MTRPPATPLLTSAWISSALRSTEWVDATPFRAHLHHLVGATGLSGRVVAQHCGIPTRLADRLLVLGDPPVRPHGRGGRHGSGEPLRRARRISHYCAARLLAVRPVDLLALRWTTIDATRTLERLDRLVREGHDLRAVAGSVDASATELELLRTHRGDRCRQLVAVQVAAACQVVLPDQEPAEPGEEDDAVLVPQAG